MIDWRRGLLVGALILLTVSPHIQVAGVEEAARAGPFVRFVDEGDWSGKLETAVVRYRGPKGSEVTLVAVMHVGEESYYRSLQELFPALRRLGLLE